FYRDRVVPLLREDPLKAVPELEAAAAKPGASALFDYTLGTIFFQNDDLTNAIVKFDAALGKFPDFRRAQRNLALAYVRGSQWEPAAKALGRTLELGGADGRIHGLLGLANLSLNRHLAAEAAYKQALVFEPDNLDYLVGLVRAFIGSGNLPAASALLDQLLQDHPDRDAFWALQANVHLQQEQPAKAAVNLEVLRRMDKATPAQLFTLGDIYINQGSPGVALPAYLEAIELDGAKSAPRVLRAAEVLVSQGAGEAATKLLDQLSGLAGGLAPEDDARLLRIRARLARAEGDKEQAIALLEALLQRQPTDGDALLLVGDLYREAGDLERARLRFEFAEQLDTHKAEALFKLGYLKAYERKYPEALAFLRRSQQLRPREATASYIQRIEAFARRAGG
ncbi:MAG TPA: tetratricopeptide repeat protein, partial [Verrucomicrobiota bacterium]|nr:tetratricopeptide repeat protein [Verrucomicrobiota bacterium]